MPNLLSPEQRKHIHRDRMFRTIAVVMVFVSGTALLAMAFLVPSFLLSHSKELGAENEVKTLQAFIEKREASDDVQDVRAARERIERIQAVFIQPKVRDLIRIVEAVRPEGLRMTHINYQIASENALAILSIGGTASHRSALTDFVKNLEQESFFENVELPVSSFTESVDIDFLLSLDVVNVLTE